MDNYLELDIISAFACNKDTHYKIKQLTEDLFEDKTCRYLFKIIKRLYIAKENIDYGTLRIKLLEKCKNDRQKQDALDFLQLCFDNFIASAAIESNIQELIERKQRKELEKVLVQANTALKNKDTEIDTVKNDLVKNIRDIKDLRNTKIGISAEESLYKTLDAIEKNANRKEDYSLYTGFFKLDALTDGLHTSELTCVGARPGTGKTAFALNIALNIANKSKHVYFNCMEMNTEQLTQRIIANYAQINTQFLRDAKLTKEENIRIAKVTESIAKLKLKFDTDTRYIEDLENKVNILKDKNEIDVLVIDYLTLLKSRTKYNIREQEVSEISRRLKLLALDLDIAIIVLVQLNRDAENKVPTMANIRESGAIEQNCDNIIFLYKEDADIKKLVEEITVILAKQRQRNNGRFNA